MLLGSKSLILSSFLGLGVASVGGLGINYLLENRNPSSPKKLKNSIFGNKIVSSSSEEISSDIKEIKDPVIVSEAHGTEKSENLTLKGDIHDPEKSDNKEDTSSTVEQLKSSMEEFDATVIQKKQNTDDSVSCYFWKFNENNEIINNFDFSGKSCQKLANEIFGEQLKEKVPRIWIKSKQDKVEEILSKYVEGIFSERTIEKEQKWKHNGWSCENQIFSGENLEKIIVSCEFTQQT
ncbi:hypothetical protein [Mycoplasma suis]|uniref:Uncharacterized protein n=1 Tax=Mycoplasma suis (strain Illinois) TaxID=768700 RepID=F0QQD0_MYCSL|nr:hypothetical protein [Mycoplasma suis]ADX97700.1 hypothetical protein MSU_0156 [Mycoplasma suis str. Illinois]